jgi:hypothetical protein
MAGSTEMEEKGIVRGSLERIVAMCMWQLTKNHAIDYLMTFDVTPGPQHGNEIMIRVPKWEGTRPIPEAERNERIADVMKFLQESCYPGKLFTGGGGDAAKVGDGIDEKGPYIKVTSIGKGNRGTDMLRLVMARQFRDEAQRKSLDNLYHR